MLVFSFLEAAREKNMCERRGQPRVVVSVMLLIIGALYAAADDKPKSRVARKDPAGMTVQMGKFRSLFASWDLNNDGFLDKAELAKAFRGANAKPYAPSSGSRLSPTSIAAKYPDHEFLIELDQDNDGKISRAEFMDWAHSYLKATSGSKQSQSKTAQKEKQLKSNASAEEKKKLSDERKAEKQALSDQKKELKFLQTLEKHLQRMK